MASFNKFRCFVEDLAEGIHDLDTHTLRLLLSNTVPNVADVRVDTDEATCVVEATSNAAEIAAGNGYTKKGEAITITTSEQSGGTYKLIGNDVVWTASGAVGPFRYVVLYNDTAGASTARPVLGWWDYGSSISLANGETFTVDFSAVDGILQLV